jgi:DNA-binding protein H-NS
MSSDSYAQMIAQIEELKKQTEKTRKEVFSSVVKAIKAQIAAYSITAEDLGLSNATPKVRREGKKAAHKRGRKARSKRSATVKKVAPKYRDKAGNTWSGRGKQPKWVVAALASGSSLDSMLIR